MAGVEIVQLWRYPVKSLQGTSLPLAVVGPRGFDGDRAAALRDDATGVVLTARRDPALLFGRGLVDAEGTVRVDVPGHGPTTDAAVLSEWIGRPVHLATPSEERSTYEMPVDPEDDRSDVVRWQGPAGTFHDSTRTQVSIVATGDLGTWDVRRFRPNLVVDARTAHGLVGRRVRIGTAELDVVKEIERCVMVTRPQPDGIERDLDVFRTVRDRRGMVLGVGALVAVPGRVRVGDRLDLLT